MPDDTDLEWVTVDGIKVARPQLRAAPEEPAVDYDKLIACPTCHARATQSCRTRSGHTCSDHDTRLIRRRCRCGEHVKAKARYCDSCGARALQLAKNEHARLRRAAQRIAGVA